MNIELYDKEDKMIFTKEIENKKIPRNFALMQMQYLHKNKE